MDLSEDFSEVNFTSDKVESFLLTKLEEIKLNNEALESTINQQNGSSSATPDILMEETFVDFLENEPWIKIFNNKYVVGFQIRNLHHEKTLKDPKVFLSWNSKEKFCYDVKLFACIEQADCSEGKTKNCSLITDTVAEASFSKTGLHIIVTFEVPTFLDQNEYKISGIVICKVDETNYTLNLSEVTVSPKDYALQNLQVEIQSDLCNILSRISCSKETQVIMCLSQDWSATLSGTFEIYCSLTKIQLVNISCKQYYVANKVSSVFDGSLIIVHPHNKGKFLHLKIYTTNQAQLIAILHHLHLCVPNSLILPVEYEEVILAKELLCDNQLQQDFQMNIHKELEFIRKIVRGSLESRSPREIRENLSEIEKNTDETFVKISSRKY